MSKPKISAKSTPASVNPEGKSTIQTPEAKQPKKTVRILYLGTCPKLTTRGRGDLSYELGIDETTGDSYARISANVSSGAFSNEWLDLGRKQTLLDLKTDQQKTFSAVAMESLFLRRSANNYGYLAAELMRLEYPPFNTPFFLIIPVAFRSAGTARVRHKNSPNLSFFFHVHWSTGSILTTPPETTLTDIVKPNKKGRAVRPCLGGSDFAENLIAPSPSNSSNSG